MALNRKNVLCIVFLIFFFIILSGFYSIVFRPQKDISEAEQRTLQKIPSFKFEKFTSGEFQSEMDQAVSDQFVYSDAIKQLVKDFDNALVSYTSRMFSTTTNKTEAVVPATFESVDVTNDISEGTKNQDILETTDITSPEQIIDMPEEIVPEPVPVLPQKYDYIYTEVITKYIYKLDDSGYIIQKASDPNTYDYDLYDPEMLERVTYPKYLYFINTCMSVDFREPQKYDPLSVIKEHISMDMTSLSSTISRNISSYSTRQIITGIIVVHTKDTSSA